MTRLLRRLHGLVQRALRRRPATSVVWAGGTVGAAGADGNCVDCREGGWTPINAGTVVFGATHEMGKPEPGSQEG
jgi:hypothetical protein